MNALLVIELLSGNYFLEKHGIEVTKNEFAFLQTLSPDQMWLVFKKLKREDVTNPSFDWQSHNEYQQKFETNLKNRWKQKHSKRTQGND